MRPRIRNVVTAFFLTLLFSNCQEPFTVKTNIRYDLLVVDG